MDEETSDKSVIENLLKKSQTVVEKEEPKQAELSDEDGVDKWMAGIEVSFIINNHFYYLNSTLTSFDIWILYKNNIICTRIFMIKIKWMKEKSNFDKLIVMTIIFELEIEFCFIFILGNTWEGRTWTKIFKKVR